MNVRKAALGCLLVAMVAIATMDGCLENRPSATAHTATTGAGVTVPGLSTPVKAAAHIYGAHGTVQDEQTSTLADGSKLRVRIVREAAQTLRVEDTISPDGVIVNSQALAADRLLVKVRDGHQNSFHSKPGDKLHMHRRMHGKSRLYMVGLSDHHVRGLSDAMIRLRQDPRVEYVEPDVQLQAFTPANLTNPNDPDMIYTPSDNNNPDLVNDHGTFLGQQWGLRNVDLPIQLDSQLDSSGHCNWVGGCLGATPPGDIRAPLAWNISHNVGNTNPVTIAIFDSGIDKDHYEFNNGNTHILPGYNARYDVYLRPDVARTSCVTSANCPSGYDCTLDVDSAKYCFKRCTTPGPSVECSTTIHLDTLQGQICAPDRLSTASVRPLYCFSVDHDNTYDTYGHGTIIASVIGAGANNNALGSGVVWDARIVPVRFMGVDGSISLGDTIDGMHWALNQVPHADIFQFSFGSKFYSRALREAFADAASKNILSVVSAGNSNVQLDKIDDLGHLRTCSATADCGFSSQICVSGFCVVSTCPGCPGNGLKVCDTFPDSEGYLGTAAGYPTWFKSQQAIDRHIHDSSCHCPDNQLACAGAASADLLYPVTWTNDTLDSGATTCATPCTEEPGTTALPDRILAVNGIVQSGADARGFAYGELVDLAAPSGGQIDVFNCSSTDPLIQSVYWRDFITAVPPLSDKFKESSIRSGNENSAHGCGSFPSTGIFGVGISYYGGIDLGVPGVGAVPPSPMHEPALEFGFGNYVWSRGFDRFIEPAHDAVPALTFTEAPGTSFSSPHVSGVAALVWAKLRSLSIEDATKVKTILMDTAAANPYLTPAPPNAAPYYPNTILSRIHPQWNATGGQVDAWAALSAASGPYLVHLGAPGGVSLIDSDIASGASYTFYDQFKNVGLVAATTSYLGFTARCSDETGHLSNYTLTAVGGTPSTIAPGATAAASFVLSGGFSIPSQVDTVVYTCTTTITSTDPGLSTNLKLAWSSRAPFHIKVRRACTNHTDCVSGHHCQVTSNMTTCGSSGLCQVTPTTCSTMSDPVCGCNGTTYANACLAAQAKVSTLYPGTCAAHAPCHSGDSPPVGGQKCVFPDGTASRKDPTEHTGFFATGEVSQPLGATQLVGSWQSPDSSSGVVVGLKREYRTHASMLAAGDSQTTQSRLGGSCRSNAQCASGLCVFPDDTCDGFGGSTGIGHCEDKPIGPFDDIACVDAWRSCASVDGAYTSGNSRKALRAQGFGAIQPGTFGKGSVRGYTPVPTSSQAIAPH